MYWSQNNSQSSPQVKCKEDKDPSRKPSETVFDFTWSAFPPTNRLGMDAEAGSVRTRRQQSVGLPNT